MTMKTSDKEKTLVVIQKSIEGTILCSGGLTATLDQEIGLSEEAKHHLRLAADASELASLWAARAITDIEAIKTKEKE